MINDALYGYDTPEEAQKGADAFKKQWPFDNITTHVTEVDLPD